MYDSGHSEDRADLRSALLRLDEAVARHEALLAHARYETAAEVSRLGHSSGAEPTPATNRPNLRCRS